MNTAERLVESLLEDDDGKPMPDWLKKKLGRKTDDDEGGEGGGDDDDGGEKSEKSSGSSAPSGGSKEKGVGKPGDGESVKHTW